MAGTHQSDQSHEGLEPARSVPVYEMQAPAAEGLLGSEVAGLKHLYQWSVV